MDRLTIFYEVGDCCRIFEPIPKGGKCGFYDKNKKMIFKWTSFKLIEACANKSSLKSASYEIGL